MKALGKESVFVGGLRVTDQETLEIAQMVLVGKIDKGIISLIAKCGAKGVGVREATAISSSPRRWISRRSGWRESNRK